MFEQSAECFLGNFCTLLVLMGGIFLYIIVSIIASVMGSSKKKPARLQENLALSQRKVVIPLHHRAQILSLLRKHA